MKSQDIYSCKKLLMICLDLCSCSIFIYDSSWTESLINDHLGQTKIAVIFVALIPCGRESRNCLWDDQTSHCVLLQYCSGRLRQGYSTPLLCQWKICQHMESSSICRIFIRKYLMPRHVICPLPLQWPRPCGSVAPSDTVWPHAVRTPSHFQTFQPGMLSHLYSLLCLCIYG